MIDLSRNILYEDSDIVVINKPAGFVVHPDGKTGEESVSEWFVSKYPEARDVGEPIKLPTTNDQQLTIERPGIVHRIDKETSGCLILTKTREGHAEIKKQFQNREIEKAYHAFVYGSVKDDEGTIDLPIGRSTGDFRKKTAFKKGMRGEERDAVTYFRVLKRGSKGDVTLVEARPKTGRTHQIRVHFQALHHPIVADSLYASKKPKILGFDRLALHAWQVTFRNTRGEKITVEAPYPEDFKRAIDTTD